MSEKMKDYVEFKDEVVPDYSLGVEAQEKERQRREEELKKLEEFIEKH